MRKAFPGFCAVAMPAAIALFAGQPSQALAANLAVELACASDYFSYCSQHDPDSQEARLCMRVNGAKLSQRCIRALVAAGEVSKAEVERRTAAGR